jgi:exonuclease SbcD
VIKILHTADWHLGATLQGWSREFEHRRALAQLVDIAKAREVDAIVIAGDIFDSLNPSAEAQRLLFETLKSLRGALPRAVIALIAGNHDPAGRLEAPRALFDLIGVVTVGTVSRREGVIDPRVHLAPLRNFEGDIAAHLMLTPYPRAADLPIAVGDVAGSPVVWSVRELYKEMIAAAKREIGQSPLIVTGHLHVAGAIESEGAERRILVGGEHAIPYEIFADDVAYVALGHLHRPQYVGRETIRYSGSLFPLSKTEIDYIHGVTIVTIEHDAERPRVVVEHAPLDRPTPCLRIPPRGALAPDEIERALAALCLDAATPFDERPFVHLCVRVDGPAVGLKSDVDAIAEKFPIRLVSLAVERPCPATEALTPTAALALAEREPSELFREAFERAHGFAPSEQHLDLFHAVAAAED